MPLFSSEQSQPFEPAVVFGLAFSAAPFPLRVPTWNYKAGETGALLE
jgi:hypothetical protein